ncbi:tyrosine-type recombinase/integrase [Heliophilum fasciatum]|nr:tyrosine-type recombinase/integrase [Heliophilum fasciatum]MCW2279063.1 site-specific recombinase XerD [Heliophilum fasciatum]
MTKKAEGKSERTLKDYGYHLRWFIERYPDVTFNDETGLKRRAIEYMAQDAKPAYYNNKLTYLRTFFNWCLAEEVLVENPLRNFKKRKADERIVQMDHDTIKKLLAQPDQTTYPGLRDYALLLLQLDTGIRPNEALTLFPGDLNLPAYEVRVRAENAKTRIARTLPISPVTAKAIEKLLHVRPDDWGDKAPVFCSCEGIKMTPTGWYRRVSAYGEKMGVAIYPYQLRHTFALEFLRNGGNSFALQKTMGHSDMNMTKRYVALADKDMKQQHELASPVAKLVQERKRITKL